jgi:hypothetical protein
MARMIETEEVRRVIKHVMAHSKSEINRWKDSIQAHKDDDPSVIAQLYIRLVDHTAEWNTAFLIANELKIPLAEDEMSPQSNEVDR